MRTWVGGGMGAARDSALVGAPVDEIVSTVTAVALGGCRVAAQAVSAITARMAVKKRTFRLMLQRFHCAIEATPFEMSKAAAGLRSPSLVGTCGLKTADCK